MAKFLDRATNIFDLSQVRDKRYRDAGIHVNENNVARCSAVLCEAIVKVNTANGGISPAPYGLYFARGDLGIVKDPPAELQNLTLLEVGVADQEDERAARLTWNEPRTEAFFTFTPIANLLGIQWPDNASLWIQAYILEDTDGLPVIMLPLGAHIITAATQERKLAASQQPGG